jgi:tetratricopeptide (TPR) repeat protein
VTDVGDGWENDVAIGRKLRVDAVLSGEVQIRGGKLRVIPRLTRISDGSTLWTDNYYAELGDVFSIQDSIAVNIVTALLPALAAEQRNRVARGVLTKNREAYELYLQARRAIFDITRSSVVGAIALLDSALRIDSTFAAAWLARAEAYDAYRQVGPLPAAEVTSRQRNDIRRTIELDPRNGYAYALDAQLKALYDWDFAAARRDLETALRLSPGSADVEQTYAALMNLFNEPDSALTHMRRAVALEPTNPFLWANLGLRFNFLGWADSAIVAAEKAVALDSIQWFSRNVLATAYRNAGRRADADREVDHALRLAGDSLPFALALISRWPGKSRAMFDRLTALSRREHVPAIYLGMARDAVGDREGALRALEESAANHEMDLPWFIDGFESLHGDERYEAIRRRVFGERLASLRLQAGTSRRSNRPR